MIKKARFNPALFTLLAQAICVLPIALALFLFADVLVAKSFVYGSAVFIVPNLYFTFYAFRYRGALYAHWVVRSFKWGQTGKIALTVAGFALVFRFVTPIHAAALFAGFGLMVIMQWFIGTQIAKRFRIND